MNIMEILDNIPTEAKREIIVFLHSVKENPPEKRLALLQLKTMGQWLKALRGETPLQEVANAVNITEKTLSDYEAGARMPRDEVKIRLANYYGPETMQR